MIINHNSTSLNPVFPSILSTNYFNLESKLSTFQENNIKFIHLDIMDGHFVDNLSFGPSAASSIKAQFPFNIDSHLMVNNPAKMIPKFIKAGSDWISFHLEVVENSDVLPIIQMIKTSGCGVGIALNPDKEIETVFPFLDRIDFVLLMSVFPGFGGQSFIPSTLERIARLKNQIIQTQSNVLIQVDGGINDSNIHDIKSAGADLFVIGTFLFNSDHIKEILFSIHNKLILGV